MISHHKKKVIPAIIAASSPLIATPSLAQSPALAIEEVIVTAQRREQSLQDVPVSVKALGADQLAQNSVNDISDIGKLTPGLSFSSTANPDTEIAIRGISTATVSAGVEQSTALYLDGVYLGRGFDLVGDLLDVERVEVLRGPQGTLFGRNAAAGAVNITTAAPQDNLQGKLKVAYGSKSLKSFQGLGNIPLVDDSLLLRLNASFRERDGWLKNTSPGNEEDFYQQKRNSLRSKLLWHASDELSVQLTADHYKQDDTRSAFIVTRVGSAGPLGITGVNPEGIEAKGTNNQAIVLDNGLPRTVPPKLKRESSGISLKTDWEINDDFSLTSVSSYRRSDLDTGTPSNGLLSVPSIHGPLITSFYVRNLKVDNKEFNQEFRLQSITENLDWFVGVNYFYGDVNERSDFALPAFAIAGVPGVIGNFGDNRSDVTIKTHSLALFADAVIQLGNDWQLATGLRYSYDEKRVHHHAALSRAPVFTAISDGNFLYGLDGQPAFKSRDTESWNNLSGRLVADYTINDDATFYAGFSQGYKAGGYNSVVATGQDPADTFDQEKANSFESGIKSDWLDGRLRLNASAFYTLYKNFQLQQSDPNNPGVALNLTADAKTKGLEMDMTFRASEALTLGMSSSILDAEFTEDTYLQGILVIKKGQDMLRAPRFSAVFNADYVWNLTNNFSLRLTANYIHNGRQRIANDVPETLTAASGNALAFSEADLQSNSYNLLNAKLTLQPADDNWSLSLWGTNLGDEAFRDDDHVSISNAALRALGTASTSYSRNEPRMFGVDFTYHFNH
ncbi:TonB-dependent receptor [Pseudoteredinibacter isoporae]|uniref:Iron complex outermembrane receptor protein n=1 Tax=Pseudoteredinibacter isoporae TaxID=570281 RepID=A0A7X0MW56_9GAMM|nr:TonB-dependent receptor [Pseudoteredinibacter isoporae]MBB6521835.1 iron complex outermembrane receptor protein [Pseudoteredinibacter isoporae]NHO87379.1 TonB-dependent receptor [Pseudoteredinibacter isoporae]NIB23203.1 TonB-dependent receptor [Pseudoteredinibacter isoporae]